MKKAITIFIIFDLILIGAYLYYTPYITLNNIKEAAWAGNSEKFAKYIDFPSLRKSVKANISANMMEDIALSAEDSPFSALGGILAMSMVDPIIDSLVSPEYLSRIMVGVDSDTQQENSVNTIKRYISINKFSVEAESDSPIKIILTRHNLFFWKITSVRMSPEFFE